MIMKNVSSSNIKAIGYDDTNAILYITFLGNRTYKYLEIPQSVYQDLMKAESKGKYFHAYIKDKYKFNELT